MKKQLLLIACISTSFMQGMEKPSLSLDTVFNGTVLRVTHGSINKARNNADLIIVNHTHQMKQTHSSTPLTLAPPKHNNSSQKNTSPNNATTYKKSLDYQLYHYKNNIPHIKTYPAESKINDICFDIATYYETVLKEGLNKIKNPKQKSVALSSLSKKSGFSEEMSFVGTSVGIFLFTKHYPDAYSIIELFVKTKEEVKIFTELLRNFYKEEQEEAEKLTKK